MCGHVTVPLDRSGVDPGVIKLRVRALPAVSGRASATILALAGGPGQAAAPLLDQLAQSLGTTLRSRRLVVFDQRGTGHSGRLTCPSLASVPEDPTISPDAAAQAAVAACASKLGPARAHYATADSVADIEAVRAALGVEQLILFGTSYGTKVALDYAAAYPQRVSRLILDSVVPPTGSDPFLRATLGSIPRVLRSLCGSRGCPFTDDPAADVATLSQRLSRGPLRGRRIDGRGRAHRATLVRSDLYSLLLEGDLNPFQRVALPAAVRAAVEGDPAPILRLAATPGSAFDEGDSDALFLATTCDDGPTPWAPGTAVADRSAAVDAALAAIPADQLAPFDAGGVRDFGLLDLCRAWPEAPIVQPHGPLPAVPTLILSGDQDLRTPRAEALAVAAQLQDARVVTVPRVGHSVLGADLGSCAKKAVAAFVAGREPRRCSGSRSFLRLVPGRVPPRSLRALEPTPGLPPHVGRTVTAALVTLEAFTEQVGSEVLTQVLAGGEDAKAFRFGGLRSGNVTLDEDGVVLRRYSYVPGVTLSARIDGDDDDAGKPLALLVGGHAAAHGRLRVGRAWITGELDGHRVHVRTRFRGRTAAATATLARAAAADGERASALPRLPLLADLGL